jgi:hypothetical protein
MRIAKSAIVSLVATSLVAAPIAAQAAPLRAPSPVSETEELAGTSLMLYLALAAAAAALLVFVVLDDDTDTDGLPASP